ncbi:unnamed protein product [Nippostrongylus brasiliensis]|uniref:Transposase n=1 Tax=Nippostrongylus brasiliensis TaxID=27835 RepID=A0A0N4YP35_NIPBR|nr:unnamed protein product [Nippostrongylus brasiliensis]
MNIDLRRTTKYREKDAWSDSLHPEEKRYTDLRERQQSKIRDAVGWNKLFLDDRWTRAITDRIPRDVRRTPGRPSLYWSDFFVKALNDRFDVLRVPRVSRTHWSTMAHDRDEWRRYWRPLEQIDNQRDDR